MVALLSTRAALCHSIVNNTLGTGEMVQGIKHLLCKPEGSEFKSQVSMQNLVMVTTPKLGGAARQGAVGFADKLV